jgi:hypothetical protein
MGGALILVSIAVTTLLWADLDNRFIWVVLLVTLGFGAVGWVDDWRKVVARNPKGLSARAKLFWQSLIAIVAAVYLAFSVSAPDNAVFAQLLVAGDLACESARAFGASAEHFATVEALAQRVAADAFAGVTILVKGSRFMRMERVVAALTGRANGGAH